jgi:pyruvate-formate lyase-activating enzyme
VIAERLDWIELVTSYSCNCRCVVCPSSYLQHREQLDAGAMTRALTLGRSRGATGVWFGGGEPTLHPDLLRLVARARSMGYERIRIQTNGMRLAYEAYARELVRAGANEVALAVKGADAATHNATAAHERAFDLLVAGARNLATLGVRLEADVLITRRSLPELPCAIDRFAALGVDTFTFWVVSLHGLDPSRLGAWLPRLSEIRPTLQRAFDRADALGVAATTLHMPPCVLDPPYRSRYVHAATWRLLVVVPEGEPFMAEESPMDGGEFLPGCMRCAARSDCLGLRDDYLAAHGGGEFSPIE